LDSVLNGTCRSSNGLGIGLIGVKEVANRFDVQTQAGVGTTITVLLQAT
jgi:anti-sigma regulatory factor (Ser/Thr protein kinase)